MRHRKRALVARTIPEPAGYTEALTSVRLARIDLLRRPGALHDVQDLIKRMKGPAAKVLRSMLAADLELMQKMDRQQRPCS
jgi:hypothetical protein